MEIKVVCVCGQKFKFDVEPVNSRMPWAVRCPVCNADGTTQANRLIQQSLGTPSASEPVAPSDSASRPSVMGVNVPRSPSSSAVPVARIIGPVIPAAVAAAPVIQPTPRISVTTVPGAPAAPPLPTAPAAAPARVGLRVNNPAAQGAHSAPAPAVAGLASLPPARDDGDDEDDNSGDSGGGIREVRLSWTTKFWILLFVLLVLGNIGWKLYRKGRVTVNLANTVSELVVNTVSKEEQTLWADDTAVLIVKHASEKEVADACVEFWRDKLRKRLTVAPGQEFFPEEGQRAVLGPDNGFVQVVGPLEWPKTQTDALTQFLSQKFNTLAVETRDSDTSGAYVFAVFDQGQKKCRAEMEIVWRGKTLGDGFDEKYTSEGELWAAEHGVTIPAKAGTDSTLGSWEKVMKSLGIKVGDWKGGQKFLVLKEPGAAKKAE